MGRHSECDLIFEDLDSLVGVQNNHDIFIVGSTNHLERLDPGIAM